MAHVLRGLRLFGELVKFEHTIFALPFAYTGLLTGHHGIPELRVWLWVTLAMVGARTAGMALNRLIDADIDAANPRTEARPIPRGAMSKSTVWLLVVASIALLIVASAQLQPLCLYLSPLAVLMLYSYSWLKRFTPLAHVGLGLVLACAPVGAWIAATGRMDPPVLLLGTAVLLWVAGFDILYAGQDVDFDRKSGLYSIPAWLGIARALTVSRAMHAATFLLLVVFGEICGLKTWWHVGVGLVGGLLTWEHTLVRSDDLSRLDAAFFAVNGWISVTLFTATLLNFLTT